MPSPDGDATRTAHLWLTPRLNASSCRAATRAFTQWELTRLAQPVRRTYAHPARTSFGYLLRRGCANASSLGWETRLLLAETLPKQDWTHQLPGSGNPFSCRRRCARSLRAKRASPQDLRVCLWLTPRLSPYAQSARLTANAQCLRRRYGTPLVNPSRLTPLPKGGGNLRTGVAPEGNPFGFASCVRRETLLQHWSHLLERWSHLLQHWTNCNALAPPFGKPLRVYNW
jgi:hypothetical protein